MFVVVRLSRIDRVAMMGKIVLKNIEKRYGDKVVIEDLNLEIKEGSFTVLVGASGCGKSTTLRMIAGLEDNTHGTITIDGKDMQDIAPGQRDIAMVFQNYALYPTMTVRENIEFGLKNKKVPKPEIQSLVTEITEIVGLSQHLDKKPQNLSGGERQRVALARAMVKKPSVFLMDEPLSNLDAKLRSHMRTELIELHKRLGATFIYVTHDQVEAMSMGTDVILLDKGKVMQYDTPVNLYHNPQNIFVAQFIGTPPMNIMQVRESLAHPAFAKEAQYIGFRPEKLKLFPLKEKDKDNNKFIYILGEIITHEILGNEVLYKIKTEYGNVISRSYDTLELLEGTIVLRVALKNISYFDQDKNKI